MAAGSLHLCGKIFPVGGTNLGTAKICYLFKTSAVMTYTNSNTVARVSNFPAFCYLFCPTVNPRMNHTQLQDDLVLLFSLREQTC